MTIELPEVEILTQQMKDVLPSKTIKSVLVDNYQKLQKITFFNKDISAYERLVGCTIKSIIGRGTVIRVAVSNKMNLLLAPEMGGELRYHTSEETLPKKLHFRMDFLDNTILTVRLNGYGLIIATLDDELENNYSYNRDFLNGVSPLEESFTLDYLIGALDEKDKNIKALMVGKEAVVVGFGNATFQEIAYNAKIHPKRKSSSFTKSEKRVLYKAITRVVESRIMKGGNDSFTDLYGKKGKHVQYMGGHLRDKPCPKCGTIIERLMFGG